MKKVSIVAAKTSREISQQKLTVGLDWAIAPAGTAYSTKGNALAVGEPSAE